MEDITDSDYMHAKRVCKDFEIKSLSKYHDCILKWICMANHFNKD